MTRKLPFPKSSQAIPEGAPHEQSRDIGPLEWQGNRYFDFLSWAIAHVNNPTLRHPFCPFCCSDKLAADEMMVPNKDFNAIP